MSKRHVIIGSGPAATNACETIRQFESDSSIVLISDEVAHSRMALPYWLSGQIPREQTHTGDDAYFQKLNVQTLFGKRVDTIDPSSKKVSLNDGSEHEFDDLLIATGSSPIGLPIPGMDLPGVQPLWSLEHTERALATVGENTRPRVTLVGAGFIGCIVLNAMFKRGWDLTVVERDAHVLPRMLNQDAAAHVERWLGSKGVSVHSGTSVTSIEQNTDGSKSLNLDNGSSVDADLVIVATGVQPNVQLANSAGIETDHGILVNDHLQTNYPFIYAAGDVAQGPSLYSPSSEVHAIQTTAVDHGRIAGANMAGQDIAYPGSLLMNVLDVCGLQCASFADWSNANADAMTMSNESRPVYRNLLWNDDQITGAIFVGQATDVGMLTDVGMVKGILQTQTRFGPWKEFLRENPFDIRRAFVAMKVAQKLAATTLIGRPAVGRGYHFKKGANTQSASKFHSVYVDSKQAANSE